MPDDKARRYATGIPLKLDSNFRDFRGSTSVFPVEFLGENGKLFATMQRTK